MMTNLYSLLRLLTGRRAVRATRTSRAFGLPAVLLLLVLLPLLGRAGTPVLTFQATVPTSAGGDVTAFVDKVEIINVNTGAVVASAVPNASFETFASLANGNYGYTPGGASWTFNARSGIAANGSSFSPPPTTNGSYVAFLQTTSSGAGAFSQTLPALPADTYQVRAQLSQRGTSPANQGVAILIDGREVGRSVPANDNAYHSYTSTPFVVDALLRLEATGSTTNPTADVTAFVDVVELLDASTGAAVPGTPVANPSFETFTAPLNNGTFGYTPAGATWTFTANGGLAASGSSLNNPNPSPAGNYVAFLQHNGVDGSDCRQRLPGALSGSYRLRLRLAQRTSTAPANQGVRVYLNNILLGTFVPSTAAFQTFTTGEFSASLGLFGPPNSASTSSARAGDNVTLFGPIVDRVTGMSVDLNRVTSMSVNGVPVTSFGSLFPNVLSFVVPAGCPNAPQSIVMNYPGGQVYYAGLAVTLGVKTSSPAVNAPAGPVANSAVAVTYTEPVTVTSPTSPLRVFSAQVGGRKAGTATVSGSTLKFASTLPGTRANFMPGELVRVSLPAVQSAGGLTAAGRVLQFNAATGGPGTGNYGGYDLTVIGSPNSVVLGDVDGDGDLDAVTPGLSNTVNVRLNNGTATLGDVYSNVAINNTGLGSPSLTLGDMDGDGDLDLVAANTGGTGNRTVSVRFNNGTGVFSGGSEVGITGRAEDVALGDVDGDGDLDLLTANDDVLGTVSIRLNNGTGTFAGGSDPSLGRQAASAVGFEREMAVGDLDGDGDLDLVTTNASDYYVSVAINDGAGGLVWATNISVGVAPFISGSGPTSVTLGDVDGDGDLDLVAGTVGRTVNGVGSSIVSVRLNSGGASFSNSGNTDIAVRDFPSSVALGDADADGDLDLFATSYTKNLVSMLLNNGTGVFTAGSSYTGVGNYPVDIALGDMDGDRDLDFVAACSYVTPNKLSVRLNQAPAPTITSFSPSSGVAGTLITVTGINFTGASTVTVNNKPVIPGSVSSTRLQFVVPAGANYLQSVSVTTPSGTSLPSTAFTVLLQASSTAPAANANAAPTANSAVALTFSEPVTAASAAKLSVFSAQVGGRKVGTATVSSNTLKFASTLPGTRASFMPGELVSVTVPATVQSVGSLLAQKKVFQFTAATGGPGRGLFGGGSAAAVSTNPFGVAVGDVDNDGDLDLVTTTLGNSTASVRLNDGTGTYSGSTAVFVGNSPQGVALGDVDGDGDLDLLVAAYGLNLVTVSLNDGTGSFLSAGAATVGAGPRGLALGDVDGDGDLDLCSTPQNLDRLGGLS